MLLKYKELEKKAYNLCKQNENNTLENLSLHQKIENLKNKIEYLSVKGKYLDKLEKQLWEAKKKEDALIFLQNSISNKTYGNELNQLRSIYFQLESMILSFSRLKKFRVLIRLICENKVLIFYLNLENLKDSIIEEKVFEDEGSEFKLNFKSQSYRDEMSLNCNKMLFIVFNNISFYYHIEKNQMKKLCQLNEKHCGGVLITCNDNLYCILGRNSYSIEKFNLSNYFKMNLSCSWETINSEGLPRAYFSTFIQNERILYILFGYDFVTNDYIRTFQKMDLSAKNKKWIDFKIKSNKIPKLSLAATIPISNEKVYILGIVLLN